MSTLSLIRLQPDRGLLARWIADTRQRALRDDMGYALHAITQATLGRLAPRPFMARQRHGQHDGGVDELIGYVAATPDEVMQALRLPPADALAARAIGLDELIARAMPVNWRSGERFSFETRIAPLVRSRTPRAGAIVEVDAAYHPSFAGDQLGDRDAAYGAWIARELQRGGACTLAAWTAHRFQLTSVARRSETPASAAGRGVAQGRVPDLTARGELVVADAQAFNALLARGLGRHRAFGFGCLLLAPAGVLHPAASAC